MAGPQHTFPTGFPNPQQGPMRNQFGAGPQMAGLMASSQQAVMVGQQAYGVGMQPNAQQALVQQQQQQTQQLQIQQQQQQIQLQQQQHLQQLQQQQQQQQQQTQQLQIQQQQQQIQLQQQQHLQQLQHQQQAAVQQQIQQQQQAAAVQGAQQAQVGVGGQQPQQQVPQQPAQSKEINTASLCRFGQETVQDIVARTQEVFVALKTSQPPNGTAQGTNSSAEKKAKLQEQIRNVRILFKRLRLIYDKCNENCQGMEYTHIESLIPLKEEWDMKSDEKKTSESYRLACDENKEIMEQVILKNRHLKEIIDHLRRIIWEINTMLTMRRS